MASCHDLERSCEAAGSGDNRTPLLQKSVEQRHVAEFKPDLPEFRPSGKMRLLAALYFMVASVAVQSSNKALFTVWKFHFPLLVALLQVMFIAPVTYIVARPELSVKTAVKILPLAVVNVGNVVSGLIGTAGLTVPMFIALRRFTLMITIVAEYLMYRKTQSWRTMWHIAIIIFGSMVAAFNDLSFNLIGYVALLFNNIFTSVYFVLVKNIDTKLTSTGLMFYNSLLSIPFLAAVLISTRQAFEWQDYPYLDKPAFIAVFLSSCFMGLTIHHSIFTCTRYNDPLTTTVAGTFKNILMTFVGGFAFGDYIPQLWNMVGLGISLVGSSMYAYDKVTTKAKAEVPVGSGEKAAAAPV